MTDSKIPTRERVVIRAIIEALSVPRNRFGRLEGGNYHDAGKDMDAYASSYSLPHGGLDRIDKATMLLQALIGDPIKSILEDRQ